MSAAGADSGVLDGQVATPAQEAALARKKAISERFGEFAQAYAAAVVAEDWVTLGQSFGDWQAEVLGAGKLAVGARQQVALALEAAGKTVRQIAEATGVSKSTAADDLSSFRTKAPDQPTRHESVTRKPEPKTPAQRSRDYRSGKKAQEDPHADLKAELDGKPQGQEAAKPVPGPVKGSTTRTEEPCAGCRDLQEALAKAEEQVEEQVATLRALVAESKHDPEATENIYREVRRLRTAAQCKRDSAWHAAAEWLHAQMARKGWVWDGVKFGPEPPAVAGDHAGHVVTANKGTRWFCESCKKWFDRAEVPA